jgi:mannosyltransferase
VAWSVGTMRSMDAPPSGSAPVIAPPDQALPEAPAVESGPDTDRPSDAPVSAGDAPMNGPADSEDPEGPPFGHATRVVIVVGTVLVMVAALVLRFWTRSDLWLDEALTVNIARLPLHDIPAFLRRDGAPPLFYVLLHFWTGWFGTSDVAVRSLSGVVGVITVPLAWLAGRRIGGRRVGWAAMLLVATSPFATRYDTETRMYSLVILLTVLGFLALDRSLRQPRPGNLVAVGAVTGLLLYTHYWSLYLIGTTLLWLAWQWWRGRPQWRRGARASFVAVTVGCLTFLPWLPTFFFQSKHTGTPWATPANFAAMVNAVSSFAGGGTNQGRALALIFFALAGLGLFGAATNRRHIDVDIRTRPLARPLAVVVLGTLGAAIAGGFLTNSAFDARYASVVFIPLILMVSVGLITFQDRRIRSLILTAAVVAGLASSVTNITTNRTQAGQVAAAIARTGHPGDIVAYCPDQLGPAVARILPSDRYHQTTFPRGTGPSFVNWVDYGAASAKGNPLRFAQHLETLAASPGRQIFLVWAPGYQTLGVKCEGIVQTLQADPRYRAQLLVGANDASFYQPMSLVRFSPTS